MLLFLVGFVAPLFFVLRFSFEHFNGDASQSRMFTAEQFIAVFTTPLYGELIVRTLGLALATTVISALIGYPLALAITRGPGFLRGGLMAIVMVPMLTSVVVKTFGWSVLLSSDGFLQSSLDAIGLSSVKLLFTPIGIVIGLVHTYFPFMVLSLVTAVGAIDRRTEEAAESLGSTRTRIFFRITLPQSLNGLAAGSALTFVTSMSALVTPQILGGGKVSTIVTVIYQQATSAQNWPLASALGVVLLAITLVILILQAWAVRRATR
ncbi:ABC transporter permease [Specibacter sp. RAF43]|uniref:ABC transporter permease n=1 Tax=Specibacter sp. RAF43 TaxID=3233057 RepID=UPI003F9BF688